MKKSIKENRYIHRCLDRVLYYKSLPAHSMRFDLLKSYYGIICGAQMCIMLVWERK